MFTIRYNDTGESAMGGLDEFRHATTARTIAGERAAGAGRAIQVVRNVGEDSEAVAYIIEPDGTRRPPDGAKFERRENCTRSEDGPPCFCTACRADRRPASRAQASSPEQASSDETWQRFLDGTL